MYLGIFLELYIRRFFLWRSSLIGKSEQLTFHGHIPLSSPLRISGFSMQQESKTYNK